jgi:kynurenine 3-monooxygenase
MLIGADGVRSAVAQSLLTPDEMTLDKLSLVYREVPVSATGWRSDAFVYWSDGEVMVGSFPGRNGQRGLFVMHPRGMEDSLFFSGSEGLFGRFPRLASLGPELLNQLSQAEAGAMGSKSCKCWTKGNVVIMGDAAHAIVPFMGQGLNTGLEDAVCLMRQFRSGDRSERTIAPLLKRFEQRRQNAADSIRQLSDRHARYLMGASTPVEAAIEERAGKALRSLGLPDTYAACAFLRLRFDRIVSREWRVMDREVQSMSKVA